jgi:serine/threonine protein kinase
MELLPEASLFTSRVGTNTLIAEGSDGVEVGVTVFSEAQVRVIVRDVVTALRDTHATGIAHRDVSPTNILLRSDGVALLCDFGVSSFAPEVREAAVASHASLFEMIDPERRVAAAAAASSSRRSPIARSEKLRPADKDRHSSAPPKPATKPPKPSGPPPKFAAPRLLLGTNIPCRPVHAVGRVMVRDMQGPYAFQPPEAVSPPEGDEDDGGYDACAADMWMLGCSIVCLLTGRQPFGLPGFGPVEQFEAIATASNDIHAAMTIPEGLSADGESFLRALLAPKPRDRLSADDATRHPWIADLTERPTFEPLSLEALRGFSSPTLSYLKSQAALAARDDVVPSLPSKIRRDSTPIPPPSLPPPDDALDETDLARPRSEGWLTKRGRMVRSWQPRFFVLRDRTLFYFKSDTSGAGAEWRSLPNHELEAECAGQMSLELVEMARRSPCAGKPDRFHVRASGRDLFLQPMPSEANPEVVVEGWLRAFEELSV